MPRLTLLIAAILALPACSSGGDDASKAAAQAAPPQKTVLDPQLKALQKAKDVQKTIDADKQKTDQAIDDSGG
jgi:ABC-type transporter MlaC component